ncbi:MAG: hemerythrin domain-containing protein [Armatimonadia bacterium]
MSAPRLDLYTEVHKGLRSALFELSRLSGQVDWGDGDEVDDLKEAWRGLTGLLRSHLEHETEIVHPLLDLKLPGVARALSADHELQEALLADLEAHFERLVEVEDPGLRQALGLEFYRGLNRFIGLYLPHLNQEEAQVMLSLWEVAQPDELARVLGAIIGSMSIGQLLAYLDEMLPAMNPHERLFFLAGLQHVAPAEVLDAIVDRAEEVLPRAGWRKLEKAMLAPTATELVEL